ncbi:hypothetical protein DLREEDagr8_34350 [Dongia sp. agr-C8]
MDRDILAILCPDWRGAALVIDVASLQVLYANWRCLELVHRGDLVRIAAGALAFVSPDMAVRFGDVLGALRGTDVETAILMDAGVPSYSVAIRRPQGLLGEAFARRTGASRDLAVIELSPSELVPSHQALRALGEAFDLTDRERELLSALRAGELRLDANIGATSPQDALNSLLAKLGCRDAVAAVRLVMALCPLEPNGRQAGKAEFIR